MGSAEWLQIFDVVGAIMGLLMIAIGVAGRVWAIFGRNDDSMLDDGVTSFPKPQNG